MQVILLVVVGAINQSKYVPMMSLAVVGTISNQNLLVYTGLHGGLHGSTWVYTGVYAGLCGSTWGSMQVYVGLHWGLRRSMWGSTRVYMGLHRGLHGGLHGSMRGSTQVYVGVYAGLFRDFSKRWWGKNQDFMLIRLFNASDLIGCGGGH